MRDKTVIGYFSDARADGTWYGIRCDDNLALRGTNAQESTLMIAVCGVDGTVRAADAYGILCASDLKVESCLV